MKQKYKKLIHRFFIMIFLFIFINNINAYADMEGKTILVIGSYNIQNEWEEDVLRGFMSQLGAKNTIKVEYLDSGSKYGDDETYYKTFSDLLNVKYKDDSVDSVFFMDDEALEFGRRYLFDESSCLYKKPLFFVGVNEYVDFTDEEREYIYGIVDIPDSIETIDVVLATQKKLKNLYLVINESKYCNQVKEELIGLNLSEEGINTYIISADYVDEIKKELMNSDLNNAAVILCGAYSDSTNDVILNSKEVISYIKSFTDTPIYSTLYNYVDAGAIGGVVNDGEKLGSIGAEFIVQVRYNYSNGGRYYLTPSFNLFNTPVFNFKAIREYGINPLDCPENSNYLYRSKYDLLLPNKIIYLMLVSGMLIIFIIGCMIYSTIYNKKAAREASIKAFQAEEREKIKTNYIMIMSHEFRTPLNIIQSVSELLLLKIGKYDDGSYYREKMNLIIRNTNRLNKMINDFIDISKLESGTMVLSVKIYNIIEVVENTVERAIETAQEKNIEIIFDTDEEEVFAEIDKMEFQKVILRLLSNSIKNMDDGGSINVNCNNDEGFININIKDNGKGMEKEKLEHIFEKFYQGNECYFTRTYEGNGIGLYIVKKIMELHNGTISINSEVGIGTTVNIKLPTKSVENNYIQEPSNEDELEHMKEIEFSDI